MRKGRHAGFQINSLRIDVLPACSLKSRNIGYDISCRFHSYQVGQFPFPEGQEVDSEGVLPVLRLAAATVGTTSKLLDGERTGTEVS